MSMVWPPPPPQLLPDPGEPPPCRRHGRAPTRVQLRALQSNGYEGPIDQAWCPNWRHLETHMRGLQNRQHADPEGTWPHGVYWLAWRYRCCKTQVWEPFGRPDENQLEAIRGYDVYQRYPALPPIPPHCRVLACPGMTTAALLRVDAGLEILLSQSIRDDPRDGWPNVDRMVHWLREIHPRRDYALGFLFDCPEGPWAQDRWWFPFGANAEQEAEILTTLTGSPTGEPPLPRRFQIIHGDLQP